ncbi:Reverse transcriptase zinc-binding domain - like 10 [Theobroma cacao]|nr:Reverse transcriptase zinc-binding domain - like 10 [Theobroma cacao]
MTGYLPTRAVLIRRRINIESGCPFCGKELETDFHIFCECPFARAAWLYSKWGFRDILLQFSSTREWVNMLLQHLAKDAVKEIICVLWAIWKGRNLTIFKQDRKELNECVELGYDMCCQYRSVVALTNMVT